MKVDSSYKNQLKRSWQWPFRWLGRYWRQNRWHKLLIIVFSLGLLCLGTMYGIARWYIWSERRTPLTMGVSFVPDYASYLGVDPQKTMDALIHDVGVRQFRLTSYWSDIETTPGQYNFSTLDWEFAKADAAHAKITLAIGLRQPRWPECHAPDFYDITKPESQWYPQLQAFMTAVITRYRNNPALQSYQLENEFFLQGFGKCTNFDRQRLIDEYQLVKKTDSHHTVIISRSNNALGFPVGAPSPDAYGISIYRRVWDQSLHTHRYLEYPFPAWYYAFLAGVQKMTTGRDMIVHELQAEPWPPQNKSLLNISLAEQNKSFDAARLKTTVRFGKATGMKTIDLWGAEYWYYRKEKLHDPSVWQAAQQIFRQ